MKLKFKDVLPNPYRDLKGNPLLKEKIAELLLSINTTGFWDNCVVRENKAGKYELAYGHHRVQAAIEAGLIEADFIVKPLDDAMLIKVMDLENREAYASSPASVIESVKAVVEALAEGIIGPFEVDPKTNAQHIRHAPSYVAGKKPEAVAGARAYTSTLVAEFLGRVYANGRADTAVEASLNFLHLKEMGAVTNAILVKDNQPITSRKLFDITAEIKQRTEVIAERRGKTQAELNELREKQMAAQKKAKEDEKAAEAEHKALVQKLADAKRDENNRKADALAAQIKEADTRAKDKEALNKVRRAELDAQLEAKKLWEAEQCKQDLYLPVRRDVEAMIGKLDTMASERNPMRELVKALAREKKLTPVDRERLRKAAITVSDWFGGWVAAQFTANFSPKEVK
jgi:ParB/RepB/Spo0J family partition protein